LKKTAINLCILNCIVIGLYFTVLLNLKTGISNKIMYSTPDSITYLSVAHWLESGIETENTEYRPILYPLLILISSKVSGVYGIWFLQFLFWLFTVNLTFQSVYNLTENYFCGYVSTILIASNFSLIALTLHALTEVATAFLLSVLIFFISNNYKKYRELFFIHGILAVLVLLTILKPVFLIPLLVALFIILPLGYIKNYIVDPIKILILFFILLPFFTQLAIMKVKYNSFSVSKIGEKTFTNYLFARGLGKIEKINRTKSIKKANSFSGKEKLNYLIANKKIYFLTYFSNLKNNIKSYPTFLSYPKGFVHVPFRNYMIYVNTIYYYIHMMFILPIIYLLYLFFKKNDYDNLIVLLIMAGLSYYYILATGVSFWQGDRLVLPSIAIWVCLYLFTIFSLIKIFNPLKIK